jgi:hypothetical protein
MNNQLAELMEQKGTVKKDLEIKVFGETKPSRGFYITLPPSGVFYLHHNGEVKKGVKADSKKAAFWGTEEAANEFFNDWKERRKS